MMLLHQLGCKKILLRQKIQLARSSRFRIFENVNDLWINEKLYSDVTGTCRLSLQDRKQMTLEEQIDSSIFLFILGNYKNVWNF
jgi:hypothetical protein